MSKSGRKINRGQRHHASSRCHVTLRKDGTVYSQERLTIKSDRPGGDDVIVPTGRARDLIEKAGWARRKFRGPDNVERKIS